MKASFTLRSVASPLAAILLVVAGCGPPVVHDTALRPMTNPTLLAAVGEDGWLAIDSTEHGIRGVLELRLETTRPPARPVALHTPKLHCSSEGTHFPVKIRREPPVCWTPPPAARECRPGAGGADVCRGAEDGRRRCLHVIRAEFHFRHLPALDDRVYFTLGQQSTPARWALRNP